MLRPRILREWREFWTKCRGHNVRLIGRTGLVPRPAGKQQAKAKFSLDSDEKWITIYIGCSYFRRRFNGEIVPAGSQPASPGESR